MNVEYLELCILKYLVQSSDDVSVLKMKCRWICGERSYQELLVSEQNLEVDLGSEVSSFLLCDTSTAMGRSQDKNLFSIFCTRMLLWLTIRIVSACGNSLGRKDTLHCGIQLHICQAVMLLNVSGFWSHTSSACTADVESRAKLEHGRDHMYHCSTNVSLNTANVSKLADIFVEKSPTL